MALPATSRFRSEFEPKKEKGNCMCLPCFGKKSQPQDSALQVSRPIEGSGIDKSKKFGQAEREKEVAMQEAKEKTKAVFEEKR